jgi:hypothetical protein
MSTDQLPNPVLPVSTSFATSKNKHEALFDEEALSIVCCRVTKGYMKPSL